MNNAYAKQAEMDPPKPSFFAGGTGQYEYMSLEDSKLWDKVDSLSREEAIAELKTLLLRLRNAARNSHRASTY